MLHQLSIEFLITIAVLSLCNSSTDTNYEPFSTDLEDIYDYYASFINSEDKVDCSYINASDPHEDLLLYPTNDRIPVEELVRMRAASRVCLPSPCDNLTAYSGFIPVDKEKHSFLFFLLIKATEEPRKKPLLLWLQGGPGKSSLFGQFLENGPLGINATGGLYYRHHTLAQQFHVIYLDQPVGSGFSFDQRKTYPSELQETSVHVMRFLRRFLRLFPEYSARSLYIAGESYGARSAIAVAERVMTRFPWELPLRLEGVMLGVGFLFPLLQIINSTDYLYYAGLLDDYGRSLFATRFDQIQGLVTMKNFTLAAGLLSQTVLNLRTGTEKSLFQNLTGFKHHGSIIRSERPAEVEEYMKYANSAEFKKRIHVKPSRVLDGTRMQIAMNLALGDFFVDHKSTLLSVINNRHTLLYTAQLDAVFPAVNIERSFEELDWRGQDMFRKAKRRFWHRHDNASLELLGYEKTVGAVMFNTVLFGGHYVSLDRSYAISDLYARFVKFVKMKPPTVSNISSSSSHTVSMCVEEVIQVMS